MYDLIFDCCTSSYLSNRFCWTISSHCLDMSRSTQNGPKSDWTFPLFFSTMCGIETNISKVNHADKVQCKRRRQDSPQWPFLFSTQQWCPVSNFENSIPYTKHRKIYMHISAIDMRTLSHNHTSHISGPSNEGNFLPEPQWCGPLIFTLSSASVNQQASGRWNTTHKSSCENAVINNSLLVIVILCLRNRSLRIIWCCYVHGCGHGTTHKPTHTLWPNLDQESSE